MPLTLEPCRCTSVLSSSQPLAISPGVPVGAKCTACHVRPLNEGLRWWAAAHLGPQASRCVGCLDRAQVCPVALREASTVIHLNAGEGGEGLAVGCRHEGSRACCVRLESFSGQAAGWMFSCPPGTHEPLVTSFIFRFKDEKDEARAG